MTASAPVKETPVQVAIEQTPQATSFSSNSNDDSKKIIIDDTQDDDWGAVPAFLRRSKLK